MLITVDAKKMGDRREEEGEMGAEAATDDSATTNVDRLKGGGTAARQHAHLGTGAEICRFAK